MFFEVILLTIIYLILKYVLAWIAYVNSLDLRLGKSYWRWTYDYKVVGDRDYSDLDDKDFVRLRRKKNKLVTLMYSIFFFGFILTMSLFSKILILILN
jgi:hypothetical protein